MVLVLHVYFGCQLFISDCEKNSQVKKCGSWHRCAKRVVHASHLPVGAGVGVKSNIIISEDLLQYPVRTNVNSVTTRKHRGVLVVARGVRFR